MKMGGLMRKRMLLEPSLSAVRCRCSLVWGRFGCCVIVVRPLAGSVVVYVSVDIDVNWVGPACPQRGRVYQRGRVFNRGIAGKFFCSVTRKL